MNDNLRARAEERVNLKIKFYRNSEFKRKK